MKDAFIESSSHYRVLARKYRPNFFREVVGQQPFVSMIQNALSQPNVPGGIMLTGTRGIGKTTLARLIAKTLTCQALDSQRKISPLEPCGMCSSCQNCSLDNHLDIQEIDAASHTGVDDIRTLLESCRYRSISGASYRVYIIDEVHMLSKSAFNSLLKTLEEPPSHVSFIFATTEIHKIPKTILSRCQQFYLRRLEGRELKEYLAEICLKEEIVVDDAVLDLLVRHGDGSVRDAFSLLERSILLSGHELTESTVRKMLGLPEHAQVYQTLLFLGQQNIASLLEHVRNLYYSGIDPKQLLEQLAQGLYYIVLEYYSSGDKEKKWVPLQAYFGVSNITALWQCIVQGFEELERSVFPLISLEMLLMRMAHMKSLPNLESLLEVWSNGATQQTHTVTENNEKLKTTLRCLNKAEEFHQFLRFLEEQKEDLLHAQLVKQTNFSRSENGTVYLYWLEGDLPEVEWIKRVSDEMQKWSGEKLIVRIERSPEYGISWEKQEALNKREQAEQLLKHPLIQKMQNAFPGLKLE